MASRALPRRSPSAAQPVDAGEEEEGMAKMSRVYGEMGRELYLGAGGREHD